MESIFEGLSKLFPKSSPKILQDICEALSSPAEPDTNNQTENQSPSVFDVNDHTLEQNCDHMCKVIFNIPDFENVPDKKDSIILEQSKKIKKEAIQIVKDKKDELDEPDKKPLSRKKEIWKEEEDAQVLNLYKELGPKWSKIAALMDNRTGKQVRDRYLNTLRPDINHADWTPEEEKKLESLYEEFGKKWCKIAEYLPGRTENQVKNKFYWEKKKKTSRKIKKMAKKMLQVPDANQPTEDPVEVQTKDANSSSLEFESGEQGVFNKDANEDLSMYLNLDSILDDNFQGFSWDKDSI